MSQSSVKLMDMWFRPTMVHTFMGGWGTGSHYSPGWPGTHYVDQAGFKLCLRSACLCLPSARIKGVHPDVSKPSSCLGTKGTPGRKMCLERVGRGTFPEGYTCAMYVHGKHTELYGSHM